MRNNSNTSADRHRAKTGGGLDAHSHDPRFNQLLALAMEGNAEAASDLCREFNFACNREGCGHESD